MSLNDLNKILHLSKDDIRLFFLLFSFWFSFLYFLFYLPNYFPEGTDNIVIIKKGSSFNQVVDTLYKRNIITNKTLFKLSAFIVGADKNIKFGRYLIPNGKNNFVLLELFTSSKNALENRVTIPEGIWQHKLAQLLQLKLGIDSTGFMNANYDDGLLKKLGIPSNSFEGYLLPDTYDFFTDSTPEDVIIKLVGEMNKIFEDSSNIRQMKKLKMNRHQILTLASIIDGESNKVSEFKRIAGVYYNRLKKRMPLQADPTIQYLKRYNAVRNKILYSDLKIESPFNTYIHAGLPPSPINNPGKDAIFAALYPELNNFLYFVADGSGGHVFSTTASQHLSNVNAYRQWRRNQK